MKKRINILIILIGVVGFIIYLNLFATSIFEFVSDFRIFNLFEQIKPDILKGMILMFVFAIVYLIILLTIYLAAYSLVVLLPSILIVDYLKKKGFL